MKYRVLIEGFELQISNAAVITSPSPRSNANEGSLPADGLYTNTEKNKFRNDYATLICAKITKFLLHIITD